MPVTSHIVRYVKPSMIEEDGRANGGEFRLRPNRPDEIGLSVNWLEAFEGDKEYSLSEVRRLYRLSVKRSGRFAEMNVGQIRDVVREELDTLRVIHDPLDPTDCFDEDPSHAEIIGLPPGDTPDADLIGDLIAECVLEMYEAVEPE